MRSLCVILLIVVHALKYVSSDSSSTKSLAVSAPEAETPIEQSEQEVNVTEEKPARPKALPAPKKRTLIGYLSLEF
jgi:hypothetical protein